MKLITADLNIVINLKPIALSAITRQSKGPISTPWQSIRRKFYLNSHTSIMQQILYYILTMQ